VAASSTCNTMTQNYFQHVYLNGILHLFPVVLNCLNTQTHHDSKGKKKWLTEKFDISWALL
jgi:hypothetical protein